MGRNNAKNIKAHNDELHKTKDKEKAKKVAREEKLKAIIKKFNEDKSSRKKLHITMSFSIINVIIYILRLYCPPTSNKPAVI
jgi:hypothetical protein